MYLYKQLITRSMIFIPIISILSAFISSVTTDLSYLILGAWALTGRQQAIQAIFMSWLITSLNPGLVSTGLLSASGRYLVIMAAVIPVLLNYKGKIKYHIYITLLLGVFFIIHSLFVSPFIDVSVLKSIVFIVTFATLLSAWSSLNSLQRIQVEVFVFGGMVIVMLISLMFIASDVGYLRTGSGFQGVTNHPQSFGPFMALILAWIIGQFLSTRNNQFLYLTMISLGIFLLLASESRTAGGAILLGIAFPLIIFLLIHRKKIIKFIPRICTNKFIATLCFMSILFIGFSNSILVKFDNFVLKGGSSQGADLVSALAGSRMGLVNTMYANIKDTPIIGIGFGIGSSPSKMSIKRDPYFNLPISAPIEKGVMPVAIIEELGVPGSILVFSWFIMLFRRAGRAGLTSVIVLSTAFMLNLGENVFFSTGGMGMLVILLVTWSVTLRPLDDKVTIPK